MDFTTLKWPGQEASYFAALHSGRGSTNVEPGIVFRGKGNVSTEENAQYDEGLTFTFKAVPGWTVILICNG